MTTPDSVYPSKVDTWLVAVVLVALFGTVGLSGYLFSLHFWAGVYCLLTALVIGLCIYASCVPCRYTLQEDHLHIQAGLIHDQVPYTTITRATPTRNPLSAPALSLDRVKIELKGNSFTNFKLISPAQRDKFIAELMSRVEAQREKSVA